MVKAEARIEIERSPALVYRFIAEDFALNYPRWSPEVKELEINTQGPLRVGSVGRQVRVDQGRRTESVFRITQMEPAQRLTFESNAPNFLVDYHIAPQAEDRTQLTFTFELRRLELIMRPFEKLIRYAVQEGAQRNVRTLKRLIESEQERVS
ncbi:SRPBCC family protein [Halochromatium salexigens]|uniref:SRPBCC family protein n=1 Tax=Halochromatium salexigens TaxID=49447 RepID=UPI001913FA24|nr:SRPBCC family protein [Halochromatium salexigens]